MIRVATITLGRKGGLPMYAYHMAVSLHSLVHQRVWISTFAENGDLYSKSELQVKEVKTFTSMWGAIMSLLFPFRIVLLACQIRAFKPDIIYIPGIHIWCVFLLYLLPGIPCVFTEHDPVLHVGEDGFFFRKIQSVLIRKSAHIIVLHNDGVAEIQKRVRVDVPISVLFHGDLSFNNSYTSGLLSENTNQGAVPVMYDLLFFGRFAPYKGIRILLEAFQELKKCRPNTTLRIVGNGLMEDIPPALLTQKNLLIEQRWVPDKEIDQIISSAQIVICPYISASQSGVIPLAYAHRKPVIASRVGGLSEQVNQGVTGILVAPGKAEELAAACNELLCSAERMHELGNAGYQKLHREWSWSAQAQKLHHIFVTVVS